MNGSEDALDVLEHLKQLFNDHFFKRDSHQLNLPSNLIDAVQQFLFSKGDQSIPYRAIIIFTIKKKRENEKNNFKEFYIYIYLKIYWRTIKKVKI